MKNQLQKELSEVCGTINDFIFSDSFPGTLAPELLRDAVRLYPLRGGKRIRPVLVMWACGAVGGDPAKAVNAAAAVEIYHNWTLVHDDIIDCDELRRGSATCHIELKRRAAGRFELTPVRAKKFGTDFSILAGDVQQAWAMDVLLRSTERGVSCETVNMLARRMQSFLNRGLISGICRMVICPASHVRHRKGWRPSAEQFLHPAEFLPAACGKPANIHGVDYDIDGGLFLHMSLVGGFACLVIDSCCIGCDQKCGNCPKYAPCFHLV